MPNAPGTATKTPISVRLPTANTAPARFVFFELFLERQSRKTATTAEHKTTATQAIPKQSEVLPGKTKDGTSSA